jgi:RNA polymerase sigma factor (sigma-70 family)
MLRRQGRTGERGETIAATSSLRDETWLVDRIKRKDLRAFEDLYRIYHPRLTRFLVNIIRRPHLVEEALNDTMLVVWEKPDSYNGTSRVSTWIFGIAYRKALKTLRRWDEPMDDKHLELCASAEAGPERELGERQTHQDLMSALDKLSPDHRAVVNLAYFQEAGYREIAEIMDCPVDTVKTRMFHARRHLKGMLAGQLADWL